MTGITRLFSHFDPNSTYSEGFFRYVDAVGIVAMRGVMATKEPPKGWGTDELTKFLDIIHWNNWAVFSNKHAEFQLLQQVDQAFYTISSNLNHPQTLLEPMLLLRSHSAYRAACGLVMGGQTVDAFPSLRSVLEYALYALHIRRNSGYGEVWMRRHESDDSIRACRRRFETRKVMATLAAADQSLHEKIRTLYERTVDYGAHPNERALTSSMQMRAGDDDVEFLHLYVVDDGPALAHAIKTSAQIGLGALLIFRMMFKERFDILEITPKLDELKKQL
ncbi:hypothetical protein VA599_23570 [Chromobacterium sp. TRC.1.1.SA]|uniref:Uncharacterized protein n=1 Tax=Chromobacterium indicum TaxID=3110228 RepID=A0ABV0CS26_9NEIS